VATRSLVASTSPTQLTPWRKREVHETRHEHVSQEVRFLVVKLIHLFRFNINIIFITNYFFSEDDALINNDALLITDFMDLKIKST
jgi:hypothetical protein